MQFKVIMFIFIFQHKFNYREYYTFEPVSFVPFEPKLIDLHLLTKKQVIIYVDMSSIYVMLLTVHRFYD